MAVVQEAYVAGVSTRKVDQVVESLGLRVSRSEVSRVCEGLGFLGVRLDAVANAANAAVISDGSTPAAVMVIPTDEEIMIARSVYDLIAGRTHGSKGNRP